MALRRSTRSQTKRDDPSHHHQDPSEFISLPQDMNMMMGTPWQMAHHHHPLQQQNAFLGYQVPQQQQHYPYQYQYQQHQSAPMTEVVEDSDEDPGPSSGRSQRATCGGGRNKRGKLQQPTTSTAASSQDDGTQSTESEGEDDDNIQVEEGGSKKGSKKVTGMQTSLTMDQMVQNCIFYLLPLQHKKVPVKRSDLIKYAMNSQAKAFPEVLERLEAALVDVFGMELHKLEKTKEPTSSASTSADKGGGGENGGFDLSGKKGLKGNSSSSTSYILISKFPSSVCHSVVHNWNPESDSKKTVLFLILVIIFMLDRPIDEEMIWKTIQEMELQQMVCRQRDDLRKFLKSEFVSSCYLKMELTEQQNVPLVNAGKRGNKAEQQADKWDGGDQPGARYSWGPRAHLEYSKAHMLKFVTNRFPGRQVYEFTVQYNKVRRTEKNLSAHDFMEERGSDAENDDANVADGENGSALPGSSGAIRSSRSGSRGEAFDHGENTETETEMGPD